MTYVVPYNVMELKGVQYSQAKYPSADLMGL